jgi:hypothetical protein
MGCDGAHGGRQQVHDLFITDVDYEADESSLGYVQTGSADNPVPSTTIVKNEDVELAVTLADFEGLTMDSIVRFVSASANTVTDYMMVRTLSLAGGILTMGVDAPVFLDSANNFRVQLVRPWIPRTLKLQTRFQLVTACEIKAFAFTGISSGNLYEGTTGMPQHDYIGLEIREIPGTVKSTNRNMQNMLAVLPTHMPSYHPSSWNDSRDAMIYLPEGIAKSTFESPLLAVNSVTPRLVDRQGNTVRAARFHLWIRLWADTF